MTDEFPLDWESIVREQPALDVIPGRLRSIARVLRFAAGQTLYRRGEPPRAMLCVLAGEIRLVRRSAGGAEIIVQRSRGGFVAEASMGSKVYHCDVLAATDGRLLRFPMHAFRQALDSDAGFRSLWIARLADEVRKVRAQNERLNLHGAAERILHYLEAEAADGALTLTHSRKAWAAELGLTHEALYRTLARLSREGIVTVEGAVIRIRRA